MTDGITRRPSKHLAILAGLQLLLAWRFWFVCDDAYITYRYAKNWAYGFGLVFNRGEFPPVEGYSDFLWLVLASICERLSLPTDLLLPLVSTTCGTLLVIRTYRILREHLNVASVPSFLATLTLAAGPTIGVWSTSGLETMPHALLVLLLFERLVLLPEDDDWVVPAALSLGLALIRTEGLGWVAVVDAASILAVVTDRRPGRLRPHLARLAKAAVPLLVLLGLYHAWRFQYYATLVPNTALVKVGFGWRSLVRGAKYVMLFEISTLAPALSLLGAAVIGVLPRKGVPLAVLLVAAAFPIYAVVVGGDFMPFGRMLVPGLAFGAMLFGLLLQELVRRRGQGTAVALGLGTVLLGILPGMDLNPVPERIREQLHFRLSDKDFLSEFNRWENQKDNAEGFMYRGLALSQVASDGDAVVAAAVGAIGYYSNLEILDQHGLVTKEVAYRPLPDGPLTQSPGHDKHVEPAYFAKYQPRWLYARAVWGKLAAGRMKDTLDQWEVDPHVMDRYVPDFFEVTLPGIDHRAFLLVVRLVEPGDEPAALWNAFAARRRALNAELRAEYDEDEDASLQDDPDLVDPIAHPAPSATDDLEEGGDEGDDFGGAG